MRKLMLGVAVAALVPAVAAAQGKGQGGPKMGHPGKPAAAAQGHGAAKHRAQPQRKGAAARHKGQAKANRQGATGLERARQVASPRAAAGLSRAEAARIQSEDHAAIERDLEQWRRDFRVGREQWQAERDRWQAMKRSMTPEQWLAVRDQWMAQREAWKRMRDEWRRQHVSRVQEDAAVGGPLDPVED